MLSVLRGDDYSLQARRQLLDLLLGLRGCLYCGAFCFVCSLLEFRPELLDLSNVLALLVFLVDFHVVQAGL